MDNYTIVNGKKYRKGYTTGSCAAAAAKAAVKMLVDGMSVHSIEIDTPAGIRLNLPVTDISFENGSVKCAVIKDGGDDPDVTSGLKIFAEAKLIEDQGINIGAGEGIGTVTMPGLKVAPGNPAINPVPMKMIFKEVQEVLWKGKGVEILLSVPGGNEVAKRTYNPRLGITGGISILGTTGIVQPMSEEAWKDSLAIELDMLAAKGQKQAAFVFGNYGEEFSTKILGLDSRHIVTISNFVGFMLDKAAGSGFKDILLIGHMGKLVKVAAGIFHTHSRVADARRETLAAYAAIEGASKEVVSAIYECRTTEATLQIINENRLGKVYDRIVSNVSKRCSEYTFGKVRVGAILFNSDNILLAMDSNAVQILGELGNSYGK